MASNGWRGWNVEVFSKAELGMYSSTSRGYLENADRHQVIASTAIALALEVLVDSAVPLAKLH